MSPAASVIRPAGSYHRVFRRPHTASGRWSLWCDLGFVVTLILFFPVVLLLDPLMDSDTDIVRWTGYGVAFAILGVAGAAALTGLCLAVFSITRSGERSILMAIPIFLGIFVGFFIVGEIGGHEEPSAAAMVAISGSA